MQITSIDNAYEDDGIANLFSFLSMLNRETPSDPTRRKLVAIIPETREDGRLDRLNCITVTAADPGELTEALSMLMEASSIIVAKRKRDHDAAIARLDNEGTVTVRKGAGDGDSGTGASAKPKT